MNSFRFVAHAAMSAIAFIAPLSLGALASTAEASAHCTSAAASPIIPLSQENYEAVLAVLEACQDDNACIASVVPPTRDVPPEHYTRHPYSRGGKL